MMASKLGLSEYMPSDEDLFHDLLDLLLMTETDMTIFFRQLAKLEAADCSANRATPPDQLLPAYYRQEQLSDEYLQHLNRWLGNYCRRKASDPVEPMAQHELMNATNPKYVLRNYLAQQAIEKAEAGDFALIHELLDLLRHPYDEQPEREEFFARRPEWARHKPGSSMLS